MRKLPRLEHVKFVKSGGKVYPYFNTGEKRDGKPVYAPHSLDMLPLYEGFRYQKLGLE